MDIHEFDVETAKKGIKVYVIYIAIICAIYGVAMWIIDDGPVNTVRWIKSKFNRHIDTRAEEDEDMSFLD